MEDGSPTFRIQNIWIHRQKNEKLNHIPALTTPILEMQPVPEQKKQTTNQIEDPLNSSPNRIPSEQQFEQTMVTSTTTNESPGFSFLQRQQSSELMSPTRLRMKRSTTIDSKQLNMRRSMSRRSGIQNRFLDTTSDRQLALFEITNQMSESQPDFNQFQFGLAGTIETCRDIPLSSNEQPFNNNNNNNNQIISQEIANKFHQMFARGSQIFHRNKFHELSIQPASNPRQTGSGSTAIESASNNPSLKFFNLFKIKSNLLKLLKRTSTRRFASLQPKHFSIIGDISTAEFKEENAMSKSQEAVSRTLQKSLEWIPTFNPYSVMKMIWDAWILFIMVLFFVTIPLLLSVGDEFEMFFRHLPTYIPTTILVVDAFINLNTGFYRNGSLVSEKYIVYKNYMKKIFLIDIIGLTPLLALAFIPESLNKLFLILYFIKYKSITKIFKRLELRLDLKPALLHKIALSKLLCVVLFIAHIFANFWIYLARQNPDQNWFIKANIDQATWLVQYMKAYYFITVTMVTVGYGDITPSNEIETLCSIITILLACAVFAYSVNAIGFILEEINREEKLLSKNMQVINSYMEKKKISRELRFQIREYLEFFWKQKDATNLEQEQAIISQLAHNLRERLFIEANGLILKENDILSKKFSEESLLKTLCLVTEFRFTPSQVIFSKGTQDDSAIYFIESGTVEIYREKNTRNSIATISLQRLKKGSYFGEFGFYTGKERITSVRSVDFTTLLKIKRSDFVNLIRAFPKDYELFNKIQDDLIFNNSLSSCSNRENCYSCGSESHIIQNCELVQLIPNKRMCLHRYNYNPGQQRSEFKRSESRAKCSAIKDIDIVHDAANTIQDDYQYLLPPTDSQSELSTSSSSSDDDEQNQEEQKQSENIHFNPHLHSHHLQISKWQEDHSNDHSRNDESMLSEQQNYNSWNDVPKFDSHETPQSSKFLIQNVHKNPKSRLSEPRRNRSLSQDINSIIDENSEESETSFSQSRTSLGQPPVLSSFHPQSTKKQQEITNNSNNILLINQVHFDEQSVQTPRRNNLFHRSDSRKSGQDSTPNHHNQRNLSNETQKTGFRKLQCFSAEYQQQQQQQAQLKQKNLHIAHFNGKAISRRIGSSSSSSIRYSTTPIEMSYMLYEQQTSIQKKITAIHSKICSHEQEANPSDAPREGVKRHYETICTKADDINWKELQDFDRQKDFEIYFPNSNLQAVLRRIKFAKRPPITPINMNLMRVSKTIIKDSYPNPGFNGDDKLKSMTNSVSIISKPILNSKDDHSQVFSLARSQELRSAFLQRSIQYQQQKHKYLN